MNAKDVASCWYNEALGSVIDGKLVHGDSDGAADNKPDSIDHVNLDVDHKVNADGVIVCKLYNGSNNNA